MRREERIAASLVEQVLAGARMVHAPSEEDGQCDFTLHVGSARFPMEVTSYTSDRRRQQYARIEGRDGGGFSVERVRSRRDWCVTLSMRSDPRAVRERIDGHVAAIEDEGKSSFDVGRDGNESKAVRDLWLDLWVTDGTEMQWTPSGRIGLGYPPDRAMLASDQVNSAIEREAAKLDNLRKLDVQVAERHLFVYVDWHGYPAHSVMRNGMLPAKFPEISDVITHLWAAAPDGEGDEHVLWRADRNSGWTDLGRFQPTVDSV